MGHRIAIGGFLHESHSFAPRPTTYADFVHPGGFPPLQNGPGLFEAARLGSQLAARLTAQRGAPGSDTLLGPPDRMMPTAPAARIRSAGTSGGQISE